MLQVSRLILVMCCLQIGIGPNSNYSELRSMASAPASSNVIVSDDFSSLTDNLVFQISSLVCRSTYVCERV